MEIQWNDLYVDANNLPRPNEWIMVYQSYSKPEYTIGRLHFEKLKNGRYKNYWEWYSDETIGKPLICPGKEYVIAWMDIPKFELEQLKEQKNE